MALGIQNLRKLLLLLPEKDERQQITDRIKAVDYRINLEIEKKLKLSFTEKSLMQNLLSGEMRVKV
jgi:restriction endonuclease S subunit